jgi:signal transduction histidine kinase
MSTKYGGGISPSADSSKPYSDAAESDHLDPVTSSLVGDIVHDLNNLVSNFNLRLYLIQKSPRRVSDHIVDLEHLVNRIDALVQKLMTISQLEGDGPTQTLKPLNLNDVATSVIQMYKPVAQCKDIQLAFEAVSDLPPIFADELDIERVVANVLYNALNYTPTAGTVTLTISRSTNWIMLAIQDTGIGISPQDLPYIFERFYRSKDAQRTASGTGLGLAIVRETVKKYGGHIKVESTPGTGSVFKIYFPMRQS